MRKQNLAFFLILIFLAVAVVLFVNNKQGTAQITGNSVFETEPSSSNNPPEERTTILPWEKRVYIVEFSSPGAEGYNIQSEDYQNQLKVQHEQAKSDISRMLSGAGDGYSLQSEGDENGLILGEYFHVLNGMAVNASEYDIGYIHLLPYVKSISLSKTYYINLNESIPLIDADDVWNLTDENGVNVTGENITIAIIDTGVDYTHPDLGGCTNDSFLAGTCSKVIGGYDFFNRDNNPMDDYGHGTHVAATAAGNGSWKGVAPGARIVSYKVCSSQGSCPGVYIIDALENATANHYKIISMSLGGGGTPDDVLSKAVDNAVDEGVVAVIAAGNSGPGYGTIESPGSSRKAITVGASYKNDQIAAFSSRGATVIGTLKPDVLAPGVFICAAEWDDAWSDRKCHDSIHVSISGTSMATPHIAGVVALMLQMHKNWTPLDVKMAIRNTAQDLGLELKSQGQGRVNALAAVNLTDVPCTAEFNTYNMNYEGAGAIKLNGTAKCPNFINYSVFYATEQGSQSGNITLFSPASSHVNFSFAGNEAKTAYLTIPKNANATSASLEINGSDNGLTIPYKVRIDFSRDGDVEWLSYSTAISQEQQELMNQNIYGVYDNNTVGQSFNWSGGEIAAISVFMQRQLSGDGIVVEIRNDSGNLPTGGVVASVNVSFGVISTSSDWNTFDFNGVNLPPGKYWFYLRLANPGFGSYMLPYSSLTADYYPEGQMQASPDNGATWRSSYFAQADLLFRIYQFGYFNGSEEINKSFASEINDFLKSCVPDFYGNCTFPVVVNSTNGTIVLSNLNVSYAGIKSINATFWHPVCSSGSQADNSELCSWDTTTLPEQDYLLKLEAVGSNSKSTDYLFRKIKDFYLIRPENGYLVGEGSDIIIDSNGNFTFSNYTIDYRMVDESNWLLLKFSQDPIGNGTLGYFNSSSLPEGVYIIRLTAYINNSNYSSQRNVTVKVDKKLHKGWPQELDFTVFSSQKVADVDNDGNLEIVAASTRSPYIFQTGGDYNDFNRSVYIFRSNGTLMEGWPQPTVGSMMWGKTLTLGDLDNDGDLEILYPDYSGQQIVAEHYNGSMVAGWPQPAYLGGYDLISTSPSLYDIDNDGNLEVIFASSFYLYVYRANGSLIWKTDLSLTWGFEEAYAPVGDFNNDGYGEILAYSNQFKKIYLLNYTGGVMDGWPYNVTPADSGVYGLVMADLDNDKDLEAIFEQRGKGIVALHHNGSAVNGWPQNVEGNYVLDLIAADLNKDNHLEVIAFPFLYGGYNESKIFIFNSNGTNFTGFPIGLPDGTLSMRPTVGDIDGDSQMEILVSAERIIELTPGVWADGGTVYSYDADNPGITPGFPMQTDVGPPYVLWERTQESAPTIADIDHDGKVELIVGSAYYTDRLPLGPYSGGRIVVWDLNTTYNNSLIEWSQFGGNMHNTFSYVDVDFDHVLFNDNCPFTYNPDQSDINNDGTGDACSSIVGNLTHVNTTIENLTIAIGNSTNLSLQFNETLNIQFYDNGSLFMNFTENFSNYSLDLASVSIEKGINGTNNYIIIKNLNITGTKTLYLPRSDNSSSKVCFIDGDVVSLSTLLSGCTELDCPGTSGGYACSIANNTFSVSGFRHSALIESYSPPQVPPAHHGGGGGTGTSTTGGGILVPPVQETATGTVEENAAPKETVAAAEKPQEIPQETAKEQPPAVEQPKAVAPPAKKGASPASIIIFCAVLAVAVMLIILRVRKKPKMGVIYGGMPKDLKEPEQLIRQ